MRNRYFSYSFQVSNTRKFIIAFLVIAVLALVCYLLFIHKKTDRENLEGLSYQKVLGMEKFEDSTCEQAYRIYYDKKTCGSICMNVSAKNKNHLKNKRNEMKQNGFTLTKITSQKIHGKEWETFHSKNAGPVFSYYALQLEEDLYSIETINQSSSFSKEIKNKCNDNFDKFIRSLKVK